MLVRCRNPTFAGGGTSEIETKKAGLHVVSHGGSHAAVRPVYLRVLDWLVVLILTGGLSLALGFGRQEEKTG